MPRNQAWLSRPHMVKSVRDLVALLRHLIFDVEGVGEGNQQQQNCKAARYRRGPQKEPESRRSSNDGHPSPHRACTGHEADGLHRHKEPDDCEDTHTNPGKGLSAVVGAIRRRRRREACWSSRWRRGSAPGGAVPVDLPSGVRWVGIPTGCRRWRRHAKRRYQRAPTKQPDSGLNQPGEMRTGAGTRDRFRPRPLCS